VLVVDDEPPLLRLIGRVLGRVGYAVLEAKDVDEALGFLSKHRDDIGAAVIDATVAPSGAAPVLQALAASFSGAGVVLISGARPEPELEGLLESCGGCFVAKPFALDALTEAVARVWRG
jgi:DNA-binding NtrC family response regulator